MKTFFIYLACFFYFSPSVHAQLDFTDFLQDDFDLVNEDIVSSFAHTSHMGAASLGKILGFEVGLILGVVQANNLKDVSDRLSDDGEGVLEYLPSAGLTGTVTTLFGLGAEVNMIPKIDEIEDAEFENMSVAVRWTITDMFPLTGKASRLKLALRASQGNSSTSYAYTDFDSTLGNYTASASFDTDITEFTFLVGYDLSWFEPYASIGQLTAEGNLEAATDSDNFGLVTQALDSDFEGTRIVAGLLFKLPLFRFGVEYSQIADSPRLTTKIALKF